MNLLPLIILSLLGTQQTLDDFSYADTTAAQAAWQASAGTPPVTVVDGGGKKSVELAMPFASQPKLPRSVVDRHVSLDLIAAGSFTLELSTNTPEVARLQIYFRSGKGWYGASSRLKEKGPQTVRFEKSSFRTEGTPAGWNQIDGIRLAAWREEDRDASLRLHRLSTATRPVALVVPDAAREDGELRSARETAQRLAEMLDELGLTADEIPESSLTHGGLGTRPVAILAYNPRLSSEAVAALVDYVNSGGKLLACYSLPSKLATALGFAQSKYVRQSRSGYFAEIRFDAAKTADAPASIAGLPMSVKQNSWNITTAEPAAYNARVIGRWFDDAGQSTGQPALLLSDRGAFFSHIVLGDDREGKKQMLATLLGHFDASLWKTMTEVELARAKQTGHLDDLEQLTTWVEQSSSAVAQAELAAANRAIEQSQEAGLAGHYPQAIAAARTAREKMILAYAASQPSKTREGRAWWNHSGMGAYTDDWDRTMRELKQAGFNMIIPNMLWGGVAHYASDVLPRSKTYEEHGDQIAQCCAAAKRHGIEVHVWKVNFNLGHAAPESFKEQMRREGRLQADLDGETKPWLNPAHPENQKLELESLLEVVRKYPVDGIHFDYIRWPGRTSGYSEFSRKKFEADTGNKVANWPADVYDGPLREAYIDWRCQQITNLVATVSREARKIRPGVKISAAVFGAYPDCRSSVAQDWPLWVRQGYLDFLCPMDYTTDDAYFQGIVKNQLKLVEGRIPVYPGIGQWRLPKDRVLGQIHYARDLGAAGFTIFNLSEGSANEILPLVKLGAGSQPATPPHNTP